MGSEVMLYEQFAEAERTFWEKATILHAEYLRPQDKPMRSWLSRDCYTANKKCKHKTCGIMAT